MLLPALLLLSLSAASPADANPSTGLRELTIDGEIGPSYVFQNDNAYGPGGTKYTAAQVGQQRNLFLGKRISVEAGLGERHSVILLYAPLDLVTRVTLGRDIVFNQTLFSAGEVVDHRYLFDGYRSSYLFRLLKSERWSWEIGGSLQIRNASVEFRSVDAASARFAVENDIGTVVALKTRLRFDPNPRLWAMLEADGSSSFGIFRSFSGAIYDLALTLGVPVRPGLDGFLRLRWLGGGATVVRRDIQNWGNFFFAVAGVRMDLTDLWVTPPAPSP
jgi:hypothetical protein